MNWADYVLAIPQTLDERRKEASIQFKKEKQKEYKREPKGRKKCTNTKQS